MILWPAPGAVVQEQLVHLDGQFLGARLDDVVWVLTGLTGWRQGAGVETGFQPRPGQHGSLDAPAYRRARVIGVTGYCNAPTRLLAEQASEALAALIADGRLATFTTRSTQGERSADVRLSGEPQDEWLNGQSFRFSFQLTAPDYRKYGLLQTPPPVSLPGGGTGLIWNIGSTFDFGTPPASGRIPLTNSGTAPTEPDFTISGAMTLGWGITHVETGRRLVYSGPVGGDLLIDCGAGTVLITEDQQDRTGNLIVAEWFSVPPKSTGTFAWYSLGTEVSTDPPRMTGTLRPAFY